MTKPRLPALDALRGLAILAVFLNHLPLGKWFPYLPDYIRPFFSIMTLSGKTGVGVLFLLSGFLIAWLYPAPASTVLFWSRRLARILPPFLTMVISLTLIKGWGRFSTIVEIIIVLAVALLARQVWLLLVALSRKHPVGKAITLLWFSLQACTAFWYLFYLQKIPAPVYYQTWDQRLQWLVTGLVNATLTLPFGQYIAQLDGVYWALITEMLFYLLYPILIIPIVHLTKSITHHFYKIILLISLFPLSYGLHLVGVNFLSFRIMNLSMMSFFITGVIIGNYLDPIKKYVKKLPLPLWFLLCFISAAFTITSAAFPQFGNPAIFVPWSRILLAPFMGIVVIALTDQSQAIVRYLGKSWLTQLGKYSYSLYLTHSFVIELTQRYLKPDTIISTIVLISVSFVASLLLSWWLWRNTEKPYSLLTKIKNQAYPHKVVIKKYRIFTIGLTLIVITILIFSFKLPFSTFTQTHRHQPSPTTATLKGESTIKLTSQPLELTFIAQDNNLGMITVHLRHTVEESNRDSDVSLKPPSNLTLHLVDGQNQTLTQNNISLHQLYDSPYHPIGFPPIPDSKGQVYTLKLWVNQSQGSEWVDLIDTDQKFISVYFKDKSQLLKKPLALISWLILKLKEPFTSNTFWQTALHILPFMVILWLTTFKKSHSPK